MAAECERALSLATDTRQTEALIVLRDLWLKLADQVATLSDDQLAERLIILERIHPIALALGRTTIH
jgi:hypothetical protein